MPPFSAAPRRSGYTASWQFRDFTGTPFPSTFDISAAATEAQVDAVAVAIGSMSNARLMEQRLTEFEVQINPANALNTAFDEAYASVDIQLIMIFQNDTTGEPRYVRVPAPDAIFFLPDGETVIAPDGGAAAGSGALLLNNTITAIQTAMGAGWTYSRAYRNRTGRRNRTPLPLEEPSGNPGAAPGT